MKTKIILIGLVLSWLIAIDAAQAQNYVSTGSGSWTDPSNWNNTSGWGNAVPTSPHTSGTITVDHDMTLPGDFNFGSGLTVNSSGSISSSGNITTSGGGPITISGNVSATGNLTVNVSITINSTATVDIEGALNVTQPVTLHGTLDIALTSSLSKPITTNPGGTTILRGDVDLVSENVLITGTTAAPPDYANLIIFGNVTSQSSGSATVRQNGRMAIFGDFTDDGSGGTFLTIDDGGQAYVDGDITFTGGGSSINNNNSTNPFGFYTGGTITNSGGGSSTTANSGDANDMKNDNPDFYAWVDDYSLTPLPIELIYFSVSEAEEGFKARWATAFEVSNQMFTVEESVDGQTFLAVLQVEADQANQSGGEYSYAFSPKQSAATLYYRLAQTDLDGTVSYSKVVSLSLASDGRQDAFLYPNPANGTIHIANYEAVLKVELVDPLGKTVAYWMPALGKPTIEIDNLSTGMYRVLIHYHGHTAASSIMVTN